ncbi:uncharacterized protein LOC124446793 [Xenia sp. Carnegie-2017]|uniref:uncharacterized protein LOC124446793 n=1 Tax=Xenia sp. Carnegie-2017 TaxID=2897299 RepID=UPI001F04EFC9|nr:uncharacterized protein LOC124446793 [Xenia sp. Carnegie-2017]
MKGKVCLAVLVISFILYIMDVVSDIYVAIQHYRNDDKWWCVITVIFVLIPHFIINTYAACVNVNFLWIRREKSLMMWLLQISIFTTFKHEFFKWKRKYWKKSDENVSQYSADITLSLHHTYLCVVEAFGESAPQCCLQNYIMLRYWHFPWYTVLSTVISLLSLAWNILTLETSCKLCQLPSVQLYSVHENKVFSFYSYVIGFVYSL